MGHAKTALLTVLLATGCALSGNSYAQAVQQPGQLGNPYSTPIQRAESLAWSGRHKEAFAILRPLAESGDVEAQFAMAKVLLQEHWKDRDPVEGKKWLIQAAEKEHVKAQLALGVFYGNEEKNYLEAANWYSRIAENHFDDPSGPMAAYNLGIMYAYGQGVARDNGLAMRWLQKAAERGMASAQLSLGMLHFEGASIPKNFEQGVKWLGEAAKGKEERARYALILIFAEGLDTKVDAREAAYWHTGRRIADEGEAAFYVGDFYRRGFSVWPEEQRLLAWYLQRKGTGKAELNTYLKDVYGQRWGDSDAAMQWYRMSAEAGFIGGQVTVARYFWDPNSRHWDCAEAFRWTRTAADRGDTTAMVNMASFYVHGPEKTIFRIGVDLETSGAVTQIRGVTSGSTAEAAGLRAGDMIAGSGTLPPGTFGARGGSLREVLDAIENAKEQPITLYVKRGGEPDVKPITVVPEAIAKRCPDALALRKDPQEALRWYEKAAGQGNLTGLFFAAQAYRSGNGVSRNVRKAMDLLEQGANQGDWEAAQALSHIYATGEAGEIDKARADRWMRKAIDLKHKAVRG